ncbi:hypothetical protein SK128_011936, partial [Halocaridina rubra]
GDGWYRRMSTLPVSPRITVGGYPNLPGNLEGTTRYIPPPPPHPPPNALGRGMSGSHLTASLPWTKKSGSSLCPICLKDFLYPSAMALHMRTHTGEKPFSCTFPHCDYKSTRKGNLKRHAITHGEAFAASFEM